MDKKKSLDLIKLEVLGCLSDKDKESLQSMKAEGNEFPWKELGDYQNLIAILPLALELKYPASDLKDKTAMKLYSIREQIKAKIDARKAQQIPAPLVEDISVPGESNDEIITTEQVEVEEKVFAEVEEGIHFNVEETTLGKDEAFRFVSKFKDKKEPENLIRQTAEIEAKESPRAVVDKELIEKVTRDYIKSHLEREIESLRKTISKNRILSFILFIVTLVLIAAMYFIK